MLLTGDIEREAELVLLERSRELLPADVLKVAHHGSRSSTTPAFVAEVRPRIAVISSGVRNRFGHPHPETGAVLRDIGARIEVTARRGTVEIEESGGHLYVLGEIDCRRTGP